MISYIIKFDYKYSLSILSLILVLVGSCLFLSCSKQEQPKKASEHLEVLCDEAVYKLMGPPCAKFDSLYDEFEFKLVKSTAIEAMGRLLSGEIPAAIISRDYTDREDSIMKAHDFPPRTRKSLADDALVFFACDDYPIDMVTDEELQSAFTMSNFSLKSKYKISEEPVFVVAGTQSSEFANLNHFVIKNRKISAKIHFLGNTDSAMEYVIAHPNSIGIGYLSQLYKHPKLKCIEVGFVDSTGVFMEPRIVHQANIIQGFYPYKISHWLYFFDDKNYMASKLASFLRAPQGEVQRYFLDAGIVPAVADIRIIQN